MATPMALISKRLRSPSMAARFALRTLCTSPQSALSSHSPPLRLLGHRQDDKGHHSIFNFFSISYGPELRPLEGHPDLALGKVCLGSSHGWFALSHNHKTLSLWNPLTDSQIQLPHYHLDAEGFPYRKLILSSDSAAAGEDCIALTIHGIPVGDKKVAFCRLGDDAWTLLPCPPGFGGRNADPVYYNGRFYVAAYTKVWVVDVEQNPGLELLPVHFDEKPSLEEIDASYLVESEGDLLLVLVYYGSDPEDMSMYKFRYQFEVFRVEWRAEKAKLVKMESLGGGRCSWGETTRFLFCQASTLHVKGIAFTWKTI